MASQVAPLSEDSHTAEFSLSNGLIDDVVLPENLRAAAGVFLRSSLEPDTPQPSRAGVAAVADAANAWKQVQLARHPGRPGGREILNGLCESFVELRGDRAGVDDLAVVCGIARIAGRRCGVIALDRARPGAAGYRKAYRLLRFAGALGVPLVTIIDTHITAVIAAAILFQFGTGPIKGFAVTLVIGLVANVFASFFVSKFLFEWVLGKRQVATLSI